MIIRLFVGIPLAAMVTLSLFMLMRLLVTPETNLIEEVAETISIDITRAQREEDSRDNRQLDRPDEEDQPPPPPPMDTRTERPDLGGLPVGIPDIDLNINSGAVGPIDGEIQPLVRVPPEYPLRAQERGLEGRVCVEFTVTPEGTVTDAEVYQTTSSLFNRSALRAIARFRYQPKVENGQPVPRYGTRNCFEFNMADEGRR